MARVLSPITALLALTLLLSACGRNMFDQAKVEVYEASPYFANQSSARPLPANTVSRQRGGVERAFYTGQGADGLLTELPIPLSLELVVRGQERYDIYCAPCHNFDGNGQGMIVQKGFPRPASFHEPRLLDAPVGYYFNVMTNGFGRMFSYASRVPPEDRWAIAAYIRALQLSQNGALDDVPAEVRRELEEERLNHTQGVTR